MDEQATNLVLTPFGWPIVVYLGLAAIAAGSALLGSWRLLGGDRALGRRHLLVTLAAMAAGAIFLVADLEAPGRFLTILVHFNPASMIAWGARAISVFAILTAFIWWSTGRSRDAGSDPSPPSVTLRVGVLILMGLALFVGLYPAWVLAQAAARPLWDSVFVAPLFLASALHAGVAVHLVQHGRNRGRRNGLAGRGVEFSLIAVQALLLALFLLGIGDAYGDARDRLLSGSLAPVLWLGVVVVGWIVPLVLAGKRAAALRAVAIVIGVFALRALIVFGGQGMAGLWVASTVSGAAS